MGTLAEGAARPFGLRLELVSPVHVTLPYGRIVWRWIGDTTCGSSPNGQAAPFGNVPWVWLELSRHPILRPPHT